MKKRTMGVIMLGILWISAGVVSESGATPSTTYWTPATSDIQAFNVWHIGVDNYFRLSRTTEELNNNQPDASLRTSA